MTSEGTIEEWRPVVGAEGWYEVSSLGRVRSLDRVIMRRGGLPLPRRGRVLSTSCPSCRYATVNISRPGVPRVNRPVHSLVAEAFLGPKPLGLEVCHGPGGPRDNRVSNLRYDTHRANMADMNREGRLYRGEGHVSHRLTEEQARRIKFGTERHCDLAREFGVSKGAIISVRRGQSWTWLQRGDVS